jgi:hypothetical protein
MSKASLQNGDWTIEHCVVAQICPLGNGGTIPFLR